MLRTLVWVVLGRPRSLGNAQDTRVGGVGAAESGLLKKPEYRVLLLTPEYRVLLLTPEYRVLLLTPEYWVLLLTPEYWVLLLTPEYRVLLLTPEYRVLLQTPEYWVLLLTPEYRVALKAWQPIAPRLRANDTRGFDFSPWMCASLSAYRGH
ncbi:hypothetical protein K490DRAFT_58051 [Saccharata proteae CBS 121410]|uniref:Uncharacterized protein n=1 Tax=Saccharata proteae CBS 121410 TaxID=1314787 RepID=A0A9P4HVK8_9PEZI|nr:hypothetical protein K490DRAFT_58051 [Saccharata proteae CBS 121410]